MERKIKYLAAKRLMYMKFEAYFGKLRRKIEKELILYHIGEKYERD
tara:strand:- start:1033 stop:1170 length:138 start_codon:yes stop_codon:yes gene_type:complete